MKPKQSDVTISGTYGAASLVANNYNNVIASGDGDDSLWGRPVRTSDVPMQGQPAKGTCITNRFEIAPDGSGSTVTYRADVTRWTNPPCLRARARFGCIVRAVMKRDAKPTLRNLAMFASETGHG